MDLLVRRFGQLELGPLVVPLEPMHSGKRIKTKMINDGGKTTKYCLYRSYSNEQKRCPAVGFGERGGAERVINILYI